MTKPNLPQNQLPPPTNSGIDQTLDSFKKFIYSYFNCHRVGIIQDFNPTNQTATVQLVDNWIINTYFGQQAEPIKPITNCPVIINSGLNGGLKFRIRKGAECLVHFNDRDLENWQITGGVTTPKTPRMHHITDAIVEVGVFSQPNAIQDYDNEATTLDFINDAGVQQAVISLDAKVGISNIDQSLKNLIATLISTLQSLKTVNGSSQYPIDAATASALTTLATNFNALLK